MGAGGRAWACLTSWPAQVMTDLEDKNDWKGCIDVTGVRLPTGYYFGASAGTGDLSGEWLSEAWRLGSDWPCSVGSL